VIDRTACFTRNYWYWSTLVRIIGKYNRDLFLSHAW